MTRAFDLTRSMLIPTQAKCNIYSFHTVNCVIIAFPNEKIMHIPIKLFNGTQIVKTTALVDCGATRNFIDTDPFCYINFPLEKLPHQSLPTTLMEPPMLKEPFDGKLMQMYHLRKRQRNSRFMVLSLGKEQINLGMPWLKKWNPIVDWRVNTLTIPEYPLATDTPLCKHLP